MALGVLVGSLTVGSASPHLIRGVGLEWQGVVVTATALTFMGTTYWLLPRLTGKPLALRSFAEVQPYLWFVGMMLFSLVNHATGLAGMPRRIYDATYQNHPVAQVWQQWTGISALGGTILFASALAYVAVVVATARSRRHVKAPLIAYAEPLEPIGAPATVWDRFGLWAGLAVLLVIVAYGWPIFQILTLDRYGAPGIRVF